MKKIFTCVLVCLFISCENSNTQNKTVFTDGNLKEIYTHLFKLYTERNPIPTLPLKEDYINNTLFKKFPPNKKNGDSLYQIEFFLGFLNKKFNYDHMEIYDYDLEFSEEAYRNIDKYPFNYKKDKIVDVLKTIDLKRQDSLWVKYYLEEEGINNMLLFYDSNRKVNISKYEKLINLIETPPNNLNFLNTKELIKDIKTEIINLQQWHGTYSFGFGRGDTDYTMGFEIDSLGSAEIEDYQGNKTKATIVRATKDTLELKGIENRQYILYKEDGEPGYAIKGHAVYLLNPPSNDYPLTKSKK